MKREYIFLFDSGNGGKFVLSQLKKILPNESYLFYMDKYNCPYGNKDKKSLEDIIFFVMDNILKRYKIKMIVIACNTMSSLFEKNILKRYPRYKIFFLKPYVTKKIISQPTLILATSNTIKYNKKLNKIKYNSNVYEVGFDDLAKRIDNLKDLSLLLPYLQEKLLIYKDFDIKNIVLGCSHFNYIKEELSSIFPSVTFYEGTYQLIKKIYKFLKLNNLINNKDTSTIKIISDLN